MATAIHSGAVNRSRDEQDATLTPAEAQQLRDLGAQLHQLREEDIVDAMESAHRQDPENGLRRIFALMAAVQEAMTDIGILQSDNYLDMRVTQHADYQMQQKAYKKKAFLALIGVAGGALMIVSAFKVGDGVKKTVEALSKVPQPVATTLTTIKDGEIQGENTYFIRKIEAMMDEQRTERGRGENVDRNVHDAAREMTRSWGRLGDACITAAGG